MYSVNIGIIQYLLKVGETVLIGNAIAFLNSP